VPVQGISFRAGAQQVQIEGTDAVVRSCRFQGAYEPSVLVYAARARLDRCRIAAGHRTAVFVGEDADGVQVTRCDIGGSGESGVDAASADDLLVDRCRIWATFQSAVHLKDCARATISRTTVRRIRGNGFHLVGSHGSKVGRCTVAGCYRSAVLTESSDDVTIELGRFSESRVEGLVVTEGARIAIVGNRLTGSRDDGISHEGAEARIERNLIADVAGAGIDLAFADDGSVRANRISDAVGSGIATSGDRIALDANRIADVVRDGLFVAGSDCVLSRNRVARCCGSGTRGGVVLTGARNSATGDVVTDTYGDGFLLFGDGNSLTRCTVRGAAVDGIDVVVGEGNTVSGCSVSGCDGEALENSATNTNVTGTRLSSSRVLLANDGTFGEFSGNNVSAGDAVAPQVD